MNNASLIAAVRSLEQRGYGPAPLDGVGDELHWTGPTALLEQRLDRLAAAGTLERHWAPDCEPRYSFPSAEVNQLIRR